MRLLDLPYLLPLFAAAWISGWVVVYAWKRRAGTPSAGPLAFLAAGVAIWSFGYAFEIAAPGLSAKIVWAKIEYLGIASLPVLWLFFAMAYSQAGLFYKHSHTAALWIIPFLTVGFVFSPDTHSLIWKEASLETVGNLTVLQVTYGPWFWVHTAYSYLLLLVGTVLIIRSIRIQQMVYRRQLVALLTAVLFPWAANIAYLTGFNPIPHLDLTPFSFSLTVFAMAWGVFNFQLIDLSPVARDTMIDDMSDGMLVIDPTARVVDLNSAAERILETRSSQALGSALAQVFSRWPHLAERCQAELQLSEEISLGEGASRRIYGVRLSPLYSPRRSLVGKVLLLQDITGMKRMDEQLRQLSRAVEASPTSIVITDALGAIQYVNPKFTALTGYSLEEVRGRSSSLLKTGETPPEVYRQLWETILAGKEWRGEFCNRKKNGELYWESASISPIFDSQGKIAYFVAVKEDITQHREALLKLAEQEERYRQIVENARDIICRFDLEGRLTYINTSGARVLGYASETDMQGTHYLDLAAPEVRDTLKKFYEEQAAASTLNTYYEFPAITADGCEIWLGQYVQIINEKDQPVGFQAVARDITERKEAEAALAYARDQALEASQVKSQLLVRVSHELRTPLGSILGYADLLRKGAFGSLTDTQHQAAEQIIASAQYLHNIVNELLDEAQLASKSITLHISSFSPGDLLKQVEASMSVLARNRGLELKTHLAPDFPGQLLGDEQRLRQILINLVGNAIKFTPKGEVCIRLFRLGTQQWGLQVADTGAGIPEDSQAAIFEPFRQLDNSVTRASRGTGLGLAITKQLVELMDGVIQLESEINQGSTFTVILPMLKAENDLGTQPANPAAAVPLVS